MTSESLGLTFWSCIDAGLETPNSKDAGPLTHYIVVRCDLPIGTLAAQLVHAAGESSPGNLAEGTHAIVLGVPDESALNEVAAKLDAAGVEHVKVLEPDAPWNGALMALGVKPGYRTELRRHLSYLPLFRASTILSESSNGRRPARGDGGLNPSSGTNFLPESSNGRRPERGDGGLNPSSGAISGAIAQR